MRSIWSCSPCAVLLFFALLGREASALQAGRQWKDVHRVAKAQVTAHPMRRDEGICPADHISCAASLNGGCCPPRYACSADACYATTAGPTTACGKAGFYACAPVNGEGEFSGLGIANKPNSMDESRGLLSGGPCVRARELLPPRRRHLLKHAMPSRCLSLPSVGQLWMLQ